MRRLALAAACAAALLGTSLPVVHAAPAVATFRASGPAYADFTVARRTELWMTRAVLRSLGTYGGVMFYDHATRASLGGVVALPAMGPTGAAPAYDTTPVTLGSGRVVLQPNRTYRLEMLTDAAGVEVSFPLEDGEAVVVDATRKQVQHVEFARTSLPLPVAGQPVARSLRLPMRAVTRVTRTIVVSRVEPGFSISKYQVDVCVPVRAMPCDTRATRATQVGGTGGSRVLLTGLSFRGERLPRGPRDALVHASVQAAVPAHLTLMYLQFPEFAA